MINTMWVKRFLWTWTRRSFIWHITANIFEEQWCFNKEQNYSVWVR
jgi:hypothetical protein